MSKTVRSQINVSRSIYVLMIAIIFATIFSFTYAQTTVSNDSVSYTSHLFVDSLFPQEQQQFEIGFNSFYTLLYTKQLVHSVNIPITWERVYTKNDIIHIVTYNTSPIYRKNTLTQTNSTWVSSSSLTSNYSGVYENISIYEPIYSDNYTLFPNFSHTLLTDRLLNITIERFNSSVSYTIRGSYVQDGASYDSFAQINTSEGDVYLQTSSGYLTNVKVDAQDNLYYHIEGLEAGQENVTLNVSLPFAIPQGVELFLFKNNFSVPYTILDNGSTLQLHLSDGIVDDDGVKNGIIVDPISLKKPSIDAQLTVDESPLQRISEKAQEKVVKKVKAELTKNNNKRVINISASEAITKAGFVDTSLVASLPEASFLYELLAIDLNSSVSTINITYETSIPENAVYLKYNGKNDSWYEHPFVQLNENTISLTLYDGGLGDADGEINGKIQDPGGLAVIEITSAIHLDSDRVFIADIYDEVKQLDDIWSSPIQTEEYVRVSFEQSLTNKNDITIYPRIVLGDPVIEIYEKDGSTIIARFDSILENAYNKVFLNDLVGEQSEFDLRILNGTIEFDHIIDPTQSPLFSDLNDNSGALFESGTGLFNVTVENTNGTVYLEIDDTNVTAYSDPNENMFVIVGFGGNGAGATSADGPLTQLYAGNIGSAIGSAGYHINSLFGNTTYSYTTLSSSPIRMTAATFRALPGRNISVINSDSQLNPGSKDAVLSFTAGSVDKLIVQVSSEKSTSTESDWNVTYNGVAMVYVPNSFNTRNSGIWYLDDPYSAGAADIIVNFSSIATVNGIGLAAVTVNNTVDGYEAVFNTLNDVPELNVSNTIPLDGFYFANYTFTSGGQYDYKWISWNATDANINSSEVRTYTVLSDWLDESWNYRFLFNVSNTVNQNLTNYSVQFVFDSNDVSELNWSEDKNSIRFSWYNASDVSEVSASYWIEYWNEVGENASIWINVPYLPASTYDAGSGLGISEMYMYFDNPAVNSESNGEAVFETFVNFTDTGIFGAQGAQDGAGGRGSSATIYNDTGVRLEFNAWKYTPETYNIIGDGSQVLEFYYSGNPSVSEIHCITFNGANAAINNLQTTGYDLGGSDGGGQWCDYNPDIEYTSEPNEQFVQAVLDDFSSSFSDIVLIADDDADTGDSDGLGDSNITFEDIRIRQYVSPEPSVQLSANTIEFVGRVNVSIDYPIEGSEFDKLNPFVMNGTIFCERGENCSSITATAQFLGNALPENTFIDTTDTDFNTFNVSENVSVQSNSIVLSDSSGKPWFNSNWIYRLSYNISNTAGPLTDYAVKINLDNTSLNQNFNWMTGRDQLRFVYYNETTMLSSQLSHYVTHWNESNESAIVYVSMPFIFNNTNTTIEVYYGNINANRQESGSSVFEFFGNFSGCTWTGVAGGQDGQGSTPTNIESLSDTEVRVTGNAWKACELSYNIVGDGSQILEFDFSGTPSVGEIVTIAFDDSDLNVNNYQNSCYNIGGTDVPWCSYDLDVAYVEPNYQTVSAVLDDFASLSPDLILVVDDDADANLNVTYKDVRIRSYVSNEPSVSGFSTQQNLSYDPTGRYESEIFDAGSDTVVYSNFSWSNSTNTNTSISFFTRTSPTGFDNWTTWFVQLNGQQVQAPAQRYVQYRADFTTSNLLQTPALNDVTITYAALSSVWNNMKSSGTLLTTASAFNCGELNASVNCTPSVSVIPREVGNFSVRWLVSGSNSYLENQTTSVRNISIFSQPSIASFTTSESVVPRDETITLTALIVDEASDPLENYNLSFYDETANGTRQFINWSLSDEDGFATVSYTPQSDYTLGSHTLNVSYAGNPSAFIREVQTTTPVTVSTRPTIQNQSQSDFQIGFGYNVSISANVSDAVGLSTVYINITGSRGNNTYQLMTNNGNNNYSYVFSNHWHIESYNYEIIATNTDGVVTKSNPQTFEVISSQDFLYGTEFDEYASNQDVFINGSAGDNLLYPEWNSRIRINITSSSALTHHQIRLALDGDNFDFSLAQENASDLRFTRLDTNGDEFAVDHWIEFYNATAQRAAIWIQLPWVNSTVHPVNMYFNNPDATDAQNGSGVFIFFDDFETFSGWTQQGSGVVSQSSARANSGQFSAHKTSNNDPNGAYKSIGTDVGRDIVLEFLVNRNSASTGGARDRIGIFDTGNGGYGWAYTNGGALSVEERNSGMGGTDRATATATTAQDEWVEARFTIQSTGTITSDRIIQGVLDSTVSWSDTGFTTFDRVYIAGGHDFWVDDMRVRNYTTATINTDFGDIVASARGLRNQEPVNTIGFLRMLVQRDDSGSWTNILPTIVDQQRVEINASGVVDVASIWEAAGGWDTLINTPGTYRVYAVLEDDDRNLLRNSNNEVIQFGANFTILEAVLKVSNVSHENSVEHFINEYETGDTIDFINVTIFPEENDARDSNVTLSILDSSLSSVGWGPNQETQSCGNLLIGQSCERQWDNGSNGYIIPLSASAGTYDFFWDISLDASNGLIQTNQSESFVIHHIPSNISSKLAKTRIAKPNTTVYEVNITNPWSQSLTQVNVTINCPALLGFDCEDESLGVGTVNVGTITSGSTQTVRFNVSANESVASSNYGVNITLEYANPAGEIRTRSQISNKIVEVRSVGILEISVPSPLLTAVRGSSYQLESSFNNTGDSAASNTWLNYSLPSGWSVISGSQNLFTASVSSNEIIWNNVTVLVGSSSGLGSQTISLDSIANDGRFDFTSYLVDVFAPTTTSLTREKLIVNKGETVDFNATIRYDNGTIIANQNVTFNDTTSNLLIGSVLTNSQGIAQITYFVPTSAALGIHTINASYNGNNGIYTLGSSNTITIDVREVPSISNQQVTPEIGGYGTNISVSATISDSDDIDYAQVTITHPDLSTTIANMTFTPPFDFSYVFTDTWVLGLYTVDILAVDTLGSQNSTSLNFTINSSALVTTTVENDTYGQNEDVYINSTLASSWFDDDWEYKKEFIVENPDRQLDDYQILIETDLSSEFVGGKIDQLCNDVRFTYQSTDGEQLVDHFAVQCNLSAYNELVAWVKIPTLFANTNNTISMYYGNPSATSISDEAATFSYDTPRVVAYVLHNDVVSGGMNLISLINGNTVEYDGSSYSPNKYGSTPTSVSAINTTISATGLFSAQGSNSQTTDMIVPVSWAGTSFYSGDPRANDEICMVSPWGDASVDLYDGATLDQSVTINSTGQCINNDVTTIVRIESDIPILAFHGSTGNNDAYPLYPATTRDIYAGSSSGAIEIAAGSSGASVTCIDSTGDTGSPSIGANNDASCSGITSGSQGLGDAIKITTNNPIGVIQQADGDGTEASVAVPLIEMGTLFGAGSSAEYVVAAAPYNNTFCELRNSGGQIANFTSGTSTNGITKIEFNAGGGSTIASAPWSLECDKPVWAYYEDDAVDEEETTMMTWAQMRQYAYPEPQIISSSSELNKGSYVFNAFNYSTYAYLQMLIQRNDSGVWTQIDSVVNDVSSLLREIPASGLDTAALFNATGWNTANFPAGTYRVLTQLTDEFGTPLVNYASSEMSGFDTFIITQPAVELNISDISIYDITETAPANRRLFVNNLVSSGVNNSVVLENGSIYRFEITVDNIGESLWILNTTNITMGTFSTEWDVANQDIWASNLSAINSKRTDTSYLGNQYSSTDVIWNNTNNLQLENGSSMTFFVIVNVTQDGVYSGVFDLESEIFSLSDYSTYTVILVDNTVPQLFNDEYSISPINVTRGSPVTITARWNEQIDIANATMSTTSEFVFSDRTNTSPQNAQNYTTFTYTTLSTWYRGVHTARIIVSDIAGNQNDTLEFLNFTLWGQASLTSSSVNTSSLVVGDDVLIQCRVIDTTRSNNPISGYTVTFTNATHTLGANSTTASGWASFVYTDFSASTETVSCSIAENVSEYYKTGNDEDSFVISTIELETPAYDSVSGSSIVYKGNNAAFNTRWTDNFQLNDSKLAVNTSGSFVNVSFDPLSGLQDWSNVTYAITSSVVPGTYGWYQTGNDIFGNVNQTPTQVFDVWGFANVGNALATPASMQETNQTIITCTVQDSLSSANINGYTVEFYYKLDSNPTYTFIGSNTTTSGLARHNLTINSAGLYDLQCVIQDNASLNYNASTNVSTTQVNVVSGADFTPPSTLGATYQTNDTTLLRGQCVDISAQWDESINFSSVTYNNTPGSPVTIPIPSPYPNAWTNYSLCTNNTWTPGEYTVRLSARDQAGNTNSSLEYFDFTMQAIADLSYDAPTGSLARGVIPIYCSVTDDDTGLGVANYPINYFDSDLGFQIGSNTTNASGTAVLYYDYTTHPVGPNTITCSYASQPSIYYIAKTPLSEAGAINFVGDLNVTIVQPTNNQKVYRGEQVTLDASILDENDNPVSATVSWTNVSNVQLATGDPTSWTIPSLYKLGQETITVNATSSGFNSATDEVNVSVYGQSEITDLLPGAGVYQGIITDIVCQVTDNVSGEYLQNYPVSFTRNATSLGTQYTNSSGHAQVSVDLSALADAPYSFTCAIANNDTLLYDASTVNSQTQIITVDKTAPQFSFEPENDASGSYARDWIYVRVTIDEANLDTAQLNWSGVLESFDGNIGSIYFKNKTGLSDGSYTYSVYANDLAGNENESTQFSVTVDTQPPTITILSPSMTWFADANVNFTITINEIVDQCYYSINNAPNVSMTSESPQRYSDIVSNSQGYNTVVFSCNDTIGNFGQNSVSFGVDTVSPSITSQSPVDNFFSSSSEVNFSVIASDGLGIISVAYFNNVSGWSTKQINISGLNNTVYQFNQSFVDGEYLWNIQACDNASCTDGINRTVIVDTTAPIISVNSPDSLFSNSTTVLLNITALDSYLDSCSYSLNGAANVSIPSCDFVNINSLSESLHIIDIYANDSAGNIGSSTINITVDTTLPTLTVLHPVDESEITSTNDIDLNYTFSDTNGVDSCWYSLDGGPNTPIAGCTNITLLGLTNVNHTLNVFVNDSAGNIQSQFLWFEVNVTTLVVTPLTPINNSFSAFSTVSLNVSANKPVNFCEYSLDGAVYALMTNYTVFDYNATVSSLSEGVHNVTYRCDDGALGFSGTRFFTVDTINPTLTVNSPVNQTYNTSTVVINITASDTNTLTCQYRLNGGALTPIANCENVTLSGLSEGSHNVTVIVRDPAQNVNSSQVLFTVDTVAPVVLIDSPISQTYTTQSILYQVQTSESAFCQYSINGAANVSLIQFNSTLYNDSLTQSDDSYTVEYYCFDSVGNMGSNTVSYSVDTTGPVVSFVNPTPFDNGGSSSDSVYVNTTTDEVADTLILQWTNATGDYNYTMTQETGTNFYFNVTNLSDATYTYKVFANDTFGNLAVTGTRTVIVSTTAPVVTILSPIATTYNESNVLLLNVTASKPISTWLLEYSNQNYTFTPSVNFAANLNASTIKVYAIDTTGLIGNASVSFFVNTSQFDDTFETTTGLSSTNSLSAISGAQIMSCYDFFENTTNPQSVAESCWPNRKQINVTASGALSNYQTKISLDVSGMNVNNDCSDLRFTWVSGVESELDYYVESCDASGTTDVWVQIPTLSASATPIYVYYGNEFASTTSNPYAVFDYYEDFEELTVAEWGTGANNWDIAGSIANPTTAGSSSRLISQDHTYGTSYTVDLKLRSDSLSGAAGYYAIGNGAGSKYLWLLFDPVNNRVNFFDGSNNFVTTPSDNVLNYTIKADFGSNNYNLYVNGTSEINLTTFASGNYNRPRFNSYVTDGLFVDTLAIRQFSLTEPTYVVGPQNTASDLGAVVQSQLINPYPFSEWLNATADVTTPGSTSITFRILNESGSSICGDISSAQMANGYEVCAQATGPLYLYALLNSSVVGQTPTINSWNISWQKVSDVQTDLYVTDIDTIFPGVVGDDVAATINVSNNGATAVTNVDVQLNISLYNGTQVPIQISTVAINISANSWNTTTINWTSLVGFYRFEATADSSNTIVEDDELNNTFVKNVSISSLSTLRGEYNYSLAVGASTDVLREWSTVEKDATLYFADYDANYLPFNLLPLNGTNDFDEADAALGSTYFNDSIANLFDSDGNGIADQTTSLIIAGVSMNDIPFINSTNTSSFVTGIMWDTADGGLEYDGSQDLVFVTQVNASQVGQFGVSDYEITLPEGLADLVGSNSLVGRTEEVR